jgi:oligopeptide/dipeptide ABC transporter ATP-binding protein
MLQQLAVMYAGKIVETGTADEVLLAPRHPYTEGLLDSIPSTARRGERLNVIRGTVPNPFRMPVGCRFAPRCPYRFEPCDPYEPPLEPADRHGDRRVACCLHTPARIEGHPVEVPAHASLQKAVPD